MMKPLSFLIPIPSLLLSANASAMQPEAEKVSRPNILIILADDLGYGDLSCQYANDIRTPNIDGLFADGICFENFYSASNVSSPSRASLLTGRYPDMVGVPGVIRTEAAASWGYFEPNVSTLPDVLKQVGYRTAIIGKWHLGLESPNLPMDRGFDFFHGFLGDMMDDYYTHTRHGNNYMRKGEVPVDPQGHATDVFTDWTIDYIDESVKNPKPFFLYLAYNAPHAPLHPPLEYEKAVLAREVGISPRRARLVALIEHMDYNIGRIISALDASGQLDNTLILFTSDNGGDRGSEANNGNLRGFKGEMYEGGIHVPCAAYWKGKLKPGRYKETVMMYDIFPTLCELTGVTPNSRVDGISQIGMLRDRVQASAPRFLYWVRREGWNMGGASQNAIRQGNFKLVSHPYQPVMYFDLKNDPLEQKPLPLSGETYETLRRALTERIRLAGAIPWQKNNKDND